MPIEVPIPELTFGVELEVIMPRDNNGERGRANLSRVLTGVGVETAAESYNHHTRPHWKIVTDASIGSENAELVSPVLTGRAGLDQLVLACRTLDEFGCRVNRSCGMHVHVGMRDQFGQRVGVFKEIIRTYNKYESIIDQLTAPSRRGVSGGNGYCSTVPWSDRIANATNLDELRQGHSRRESKVNLHAYWRHGTIEFRHHQGTVNGEKARNWVLFCLRLVAHGAKNNERSRTPLSTLAPPPFMPSVFRTRPPTLPDRPRFTDPVDYTACPRFAGTGDDIPRFIAANRFYLLNVVIVRVTPIERTTRRNRTSEGYLNYTRHNVVGTNLWDYNRHGGRRTHLAWDVDHRFVELVDLNLLPDRTLSLPRIRPDEAELARRAHAINQHEELVRQLTAENDRAERERRARFDEAEAARRAAHDRALAAYEQQQRQLETGPRPPLVRPGTDAAPRTLEGLFDLLEMPPSERTYFAERQMELNS